MAWRELERSSRLVLVGVAALVAYAYLRAGGKPSWTDGAFLVILVAVAAGTSWLRSALAPVVLSPMHRPQRGDGRRVSLDPVGVIVPGAVIGLQALFLTAVGLPFAWVRPDSATDRNRVRHAPLSRQVIYAVLPLLIYFGITLVAGRLLVNRQTSTDLVGQVTTVNDNGVITQLLVMTVFAGVFYFVIGLFPVPGQPMGDVLEPALSEKWLDRFDRFRRWGNLAVAIACIAAAGLVARLISLPAGILLDVIGIN